MRWVDKTTELTEWIITSILHARVNTWVNCFFFWTKSLWQVTFYSMALYSKYDTIFTTDKNDWQSPGFDWGWCLTLSSSRARIKINQGHEGHGLGCPAQSCPWPSPALTLTMDRWRYYNLHPRTRCKKVSVNLIMHFLTVTGAFFNKTRLYAFSNRCLL
jgi:hypothetical protein